MQKLITFLFLIGVAALAIIPARAAECLSSLRMVATVDTETDSKGGMLLPGNFGGVRKLLLVDTGGFFHELRSSVIKELGLPTRENRKVMVVDVLGGATALVARAPSFSIGAMSSTPVDFVVITNDSLLGNPAIAGVFFPGVYYRVLDVDLDFPGHKFNLLSQDHCPGAVVYWPNTGGAVIPIRFDGVHIVLPVKVDGYDLRATLDSGASETVMYTRVARDLGVDVDKGQATETGQLGANVNVRTYEHRFRLESIEGITVNNPMFSLIPDLNTHMQEGPSIAGGNETRLGTPHTRTGDDMLIGMSILRHLHVYIATKEQKLYITAGDAPAAPVSQP